MEQRKDRGWPDVTRNAASFRSVRHSRHEIEVPITTYTRAEIAERVRRLRDAERAEFLDPDCWPNGGPTIEAKLEIGTYALTLQEEEQAVEQRQQEEVTESANARKIAALEKPAMRFADVWNADRVYAAGVPSL